MADLIIPKRKLALPGIADLRTPLSARLVALWPFDDGAGVRVRDLSGHLNHGTLSGGTWQRNSAVEFDGTDIMSCAGPVLSQSQGTLVLFLRRTGAPDNYGGVVNVETPSNDSTHELILFFQDVSVNEGLRFYPNITQDNGDYWEWDADYEDTLPLGEDVCLAVTWNNGVAIAGYKNGRPHGSQTGDGSWTAAAFAGGEQFYLGRTAGVEFTSACEFQAVLAYDRALPPDAIARLYKDADWWRYTKEMRHSIPVAETTSTTSTTTTTSSTTSTASTSSSTSSTTSSSSTASTSSSTSSTASSSTTSTTASTTSSTSSTTTAGGEQHIQCQDGLYDLTTQQTIYTYTNTDTEVWVCQGIVVFGDGSNDLDGSGGDFELTLMFGNQTNQPDPQCITFSSATRTSVFTEQFPLAVNETVTFKVKSPNAADTNVYVRACLYEVGVESLRDDLSEVLSQILQNQTSVDSNEDYSSATGGGSVSGGVTSGEGVGVYPGAC